jgi:drug/metabolite transporter (DMT)-like permease
VILGGVVAALAGAVLLALGAQFQGRGVRGVGETDGRGRYGFRRVLELLRSRGWLLGTAFLTGAILLQLVGLLMAPLPVVQPLGVLSLVVTALLNRRLAHARMQPRGVLGIAICVFGTTAFVVTAAFTTRTADEPPEVVTPVLVLIGIVLIVLLVGYATLRNRVPAVAFALAGGICFGFVATLMKVVLDRCSAAVQQHGTLFDATTPFTVLVGAAAAAA